MVSPNPRAESFIQQVVSRTVYRPDGSTEQTRSPAVWTLAHRGYSGPNRLDIWVYPSQAAALRAGAILAMDCGLDEDAPARELMQRRKYQAILDRYEEISPDTHLLRVQAAFLNWPDADDPR